MGVMNQSKTAVETKINNQLSLSETAVVQCLLYFEAFTYPLTKEEIFNFCSIKINNESDLDITLSSLLKRNLIKEKGLFYHVHDTDNIVDRRIKGNKMAKQIMPKAMRYGKLIAQFPFVETVCISGSLSKNYFDEKGDVDFFIITKPQRLWLCRSLLVGFKKVFLLNSRKYFCVNYFVGSDNLSIPDCNIFTATEIASLIPVYNFSGYNSFIEQNKWVYKHLPNFDLNKKKSTSAKNESIIKKVSERLLSTGIGAFADKQLFKLTLNIWQRKFKHFNKSDFDLNMRSRKNVSKHHPSGFQQKVLRLWDTNKNKYSSAHQIVFSNI